MRSETHFRPLATQSVAFTGTAGTVANGVSVGVSVVRLYSTTDAFVAIGNSPTATTSGMPLAGGLPEYITLHQGEKVSAIQSSAAGTLYVTEMSQ